MSDHAFDEGLPPTAPAQPSPTSEARSSVSAASGKDSASNWAAPGPTRFNESAGVTEPAILPDAERPADAEPPVSSADFPAIDDEKSFDDQPPSEQQAGDPDQDYFAIDTDAKLDGDVPSHPVDSSVEPIDRPIFSRLELLTRKIDQYPNAPVNYVLRGEVYFDLSDFEHAAADFRTAIALAEQQDETLDWGYVNAAFIDRAEEGLRQIDG